MLPHKERQYTIASALPKPCFFEDFYGPYAKASEKGPYFLTEYSTHQLFSQLTLLQQVKGSARPSQSGGSRPLAGGQGGVSGRDALALTGPEQMFAGGTHRRAVNGASCWMLRPRGGPRRSLGSRPTQGTQGPVHRVLTLPPRQHWRALCGPPGGVGLLPLGAGRPTGLRHAPLVPS